MGPRRSCWSAQGHTSGLLGACWHPTDKERWITWAGDATVRFWHISGRRSFDELYCESVIKLKDARGQRAGVTAGAFSADGRRIGAGTEDGSVAWYDGVRRSPSGRPDGVVRGAHTDGPASGAAFSPDGMKLATRGADGTLKARARWSRA